mmetsp:Transcript_5035/g.9208  ORF Transcript_5035/g.9208 Transcript_5035/m.9208 type:complete len:86 (+) Transcript_5035:456-713(+)
MLELEVGWLVIVIILSSDKKLAYPRGNWGNSQMVSLSFSDVSSEVTSQSSYSDSLLMVPEVEQLRSQLAHVYYLIGVIMMMIMIA